jgi:serine/threonine protein kinase
MKPKLDFPYLSEISADLLTKLLEKDPTKRLGNTEAGL